MAIINKLAILGDVTKQNPDVINSYTTAAGTDGQIDGFQQNKFIYVDQVNTILRSTSLVTYSLVEIMKSSASSSGTLEASTAPTTAKGYIKSALDGYIASIKVNESAQADLALALSATNTSKSATTPIYLDNNGVARDVSSIGASLLPYASSNAKGAIRIEYDSTTFTLNIYTSDPTLN